MKKATLPVMTVYTDGGSRPNPGPSAWAFVATHPDGTTTITSGHLGIATNNVAEYQALVNAIKYALSKGVDHLVIYSDSQLMVNHMKGEWAVKHDNLRPLWAEAKLLSEQFKLFKIEHVRRTFNKVADAEVNRRLDLGE